MPTLVQLVFCRRRHHPLRGNVIDLAYSVF
jgi:hypothetical protein